MTSVFTFGLNHHSAPVDVRERVSMSGDLVRPALDGLRACFNGRVKEAAILSTCNRTEIYVAAQPDAAEHIGQWMADFNSLDSSVISPHLYEYSQDMAVRHAFRVASGLDSMVLGEAQILGQMKNAVRAASEAGALGTMLNQLFQKTFSVAKEVRSNTAIGQESVSMAAAAVRMSERVFGDLDNSKVLFVGAGEMIELCVTHFAAHNPKQIVIANRTIERGEVLASRFRADVIKLAELPERIHEFDVVVSCTASTLPILGLGMIQSALKHRRFQPMVMVDLAVPRDIEPEVGRLGEVYLYTVDDLGRMVQMGNDIRKAAVVEAEQIIDSSVSNFMNWLKTREVVPVIQSLNNSAQTLAQIELDKARKLLAKGVSPEEALERLAQGLTQKYMHAPMRALNKSQNEEREQILDVLPKLFPTH